jgi:hypothetical protein
MWFVKWLFAIALLQTTGWVFETAIPPGEGRPRLRPTGPIEVRQHPELKHLVSAKLNVPLNRDLEYDETIFRTVVPGEIRVRAETSVSGRQLGPISRLSREEYYRGRYPRGTVAVTRDSRVEYLQYRAEGTCFVRIDGEVIDADDCPALDNEAFTVVSEPRTEWWVRIRNDAKPLGWVLVDERRVKVVGRSF